MGIYYNMYIFYGFYIIGDYKTLSVDIKSKYINVSIDQVDKGAIIYFKSTYNKVYGQIFQLWEEKTITNKELVKYTKDSIKSTWYKLSLKDEEILKNILKDYKIPNRKLDRWLYVECGGTYGYKQNITRIRVTL